MNVHVSQMKIIFTILSVGTCFLSRAPHSLKEHSLFRSPSSSLTPGPDAQDLQMGVKTHELMGAYVRAIGRPSLEIDSGWVSAPSHCLV